MGWRRLFFSGVVTCLLLHGMPLFAQTPCVGLVADCDDDGRVTIGELVTSVNILLGNADLARCRAADRRGSDGRVSVNELVLAVIDALEGCNCVEDCDDGDPCTRDGCAKERVMDVCVHGPIACPDDGNECTGEICDVGGGCISSSEAVDGFLCQGGDGRCQSGVCVARPSAPTPTMTEITELPSPTPTSTAAGL